MNYNFPVINTIQDVLPHIKGREEFIVMEKDNYTVIDYVMQSSATFPNPMVDYGEGLGVCPDIAKLRECRGLIFDKEGKLISRPFHKFFNYGEKPEEQKDCGLPEVMLEKLDGSMIRPLIIDGDIRLATRKGITDVAMQAEVFAAGKDNYINFISLMAAQNMTPIFEWCSRKNQIVIDYPEENLILLAIRHINSGEYLPYDIMKTTAQSFNIPIVGNALGMVVATGEDFSIDQWKDAVNTFKDKEGYVAKFENGHMFKIKSEWYVTLHRAKDAIGREKDLIKAYLTTGVDDILPILPEAYKQEVTDFLKTLTEEIIKTCQRIDGIFTNLIKDLPEQFTRKEFALKVLNLDPKYKSIMFNLLPGDSSMEVILPYIIKACGSKKTLDEHRWLIGGIRFGDKVKEEVVAA